MENMALWHERDISHSSTERIILPDSSLALDYGLSLFTSVMAGLDVYPKMKKKNLDITKGLIFSQRVMLTLIDKGLGRKKAYELVQRNAIKAVERSKHFLTQLKSDAEVMAVLPAEELEPLFNEQYYLRYIDDIFKRVGLTETQWKEKTRAAENNLAPRTM
jgi:adenylosuccinate lyase